MRPVSQLRKAFKHVWIPVDPHNEVIKDHRMDNHIPFSQNPWWTDEEPPRDGDPSKERGPVHGPIDDEWSDLLLELTLAMAYANIIENTPIVGAVSASSFLAFFALLWWIWASQVTYNVRFRTKDVMHRIFAIFQFLIFGTMATFTSNFNIFSGLLQDYSQTPINPVDFQIGNANFSSVFGSSLRQERLPVLNARGISITMACSRVLLLIQYGVVLYYSNKTIEHKVYRRSIIIHMGTLLVSFVAYLITLGVIGYNPTSGNDIGKIFLWFAPMVFEIGSYFYIVNRVEDHVKIKSESVHKRSATLFVVILGEGLNQITGSFKYVVGAVGFTAKGVGIMFSAAVIIMGELALYSRNNWKTWRGGNHILLWFFSHYVLMATLILTLQCVRTLLSFANLHTSITTLVAMADDIARRASSGNASSVTADMFPDAENAFVALGLPFADFIDVVNAGLADFVGELTKNLQPGAGDTAAGTKLAQTFIYVACVAFNEFDAFPEEGSALYNEVQTFLGASYIYPPTVFTMLGDLLASRLHSAFWFWGTAGATLMMLAILSLLKQKPTDKYEFASIMSRFWFGFIFLTLSGLIAGHNRPYFANADTATTNLHTSRPWKAAGSAWVIPSFAIVVVVVNLIDNIIAFLARKSYARDELNIQVVEKTDGHAAAEDLPHLEFV